MSQRDGRGVITGIDVPLEMAVMLCLAGLALGLWAGRRQVSRRRDLGTSPLAALMQPATLKNAADLANHRSAIRAASHAVLHGQIDQLGPLRTIWSPEAREQVQGHVAAVLRAGLRRDDSFADSDGDGFTIILPGADERTAARIADRLRRSLGQLRLPQLGGTAQVTASFGVAAQRFGDNGDMLARRARMALEAALHDGADQVITASEIEDVIMLPAPDSVGSAASAA
jgi:diguanylate cyclase (GGDEF)-like protein